MGPAQARARRRCCRLLLPPATCCCRWPAADAALCKQTFQAPLCRSSTWVYLASPWPAPTSHVRLPAAARRRLRPLASCPMRRACRARCSLPLPLAPRATGQIDKGPLCTLWVGIAAWYPLFRSHDQARPCRRRWLLLTPLPLAAPRRRQLGLMALVHAPPLLHPSRRNCTDGMRLWQPPVAPSRCATSCCRSTTPCCTKARGPRGASGLATACCRAAGRCDDAGRHGVASPCAALKRRRPSPHVPAQALRPAPRCCARCGWSGRPTTTPLTSPRLQPPGALRAARCAPRLVPRRLLHPRASLPIPHRLHCLPRTAWAPRLHLPAGSSWSAIKSWCRQPPPSMPQTLLPTSRRRAPTCPPPCQPCLPAVCTCRACRLDQGSISCITLSVLPTSCSHLTPCLGLQGLWYSVWDWSRTVDARAGPLMTVLNVTQEAVPGSNATAPLTSAHYRRAARAGSPCAAWQGGL